MKDDSLRAWLSELPDPGVVTPSVIACPDCSQQLAVRFTFERIPARIVADSEWTEASPHVRTRPWSRTDAGRPARHAGYQKRTRREPVQLSSGELRDWAYSETYPGIQELDPADVLVCRCGSRVPVAENHAIG